MNIEMRYIMRIMSHLDQCKHVSDTPFVLNFRCPLCGDSVYNKTKKRAYLLEKGQSIFFYCHNCGVSMSFQSFLKIQYPSLFNEYKLDKMKSKGLFDKMGDEEENMFNTGTPCFKKSLQLGKAICYCDDNDLVFNYVKSRKIPKTLWNSLFSCDNLTLLTKQIKRYENMEVSSSALVIPFFDEKRQYSHLVARLIDNKIRYLSLEIDDKRPKLWGIEHIDWNKKIYVFEGPIDAMCVPNSLALGGSAGNAAIKTIMENINIPVDNVCFVYDNEMTSNRQILGQVKKRISEGFSVVVYNSDFIGKDVNEVICNNQMTFDDIKLYLDSRTFSGLRAELEISKLTKTRGNHER